MVLLRWQVRVRPWYYSLDLSTRPAKLKLMSPTMSEHACQRRTKRVLKFMLLRHGRISSKPLHCIYEVSRMCGHWAQDPWLSIHQDTGSSRMMTFGRLSLASFLEHEPNLQGQRTKERGPPSFAGCLLDLAHFLLSAN